MQQNILVTGGYGFLGQYVIKALVGKWPQVFIKILDINRPSKPYYKFESNPQVTSSMVNICDYEEILPLFKDVDIVIHLAGLNSSSLKDKDRLFEINVKGTENVLKAMSHHKISHLIHISSVAAMGYRKDGKVPIDENFIFDWSIAQRLGKYYMLTKHLADVKVVEFRKKGINSVILHPSLMYGPGDATNSSRMIRAIKDGKVPLNVPGGTSVIHVKDVADGIIAALKKDVSNDNFLLSGFNYSFIEINKLIADVMGASPPKRTMPRFLHPVLFRLFRLVERLSTNKLQLCADDIDNSFRFRYYDNSKARQQLDWMPSISFEQTIIEMKEWMEENDYLEE